MSDATTAGLRRPALLVIVLVAINLRTVIGSVPPLLADVRHDLGLSATVAGLLTTLPVLCFGLLAPITPWLARRIALERLLAGCVAATAGAAGLYSLGTTAAMFAGCLLAGVGVAVAQVALPTLIRIRYPEAMGRMIGGYTAALPLGGALAAATAVPLADALGGDWAPALAVFAVPAVIAIVLWAPTALRGHSTLAGAPSVAVRREPLAWALALLFGLQSAAFFASLTWLPTILQDDGTADDVAGVLQAVAALVSMIPAFLVPVLAARMRSQLPLLVSVIAVYCGGILGLLAFPALPLLWVSLIGLGQGGLLGLSFMLPGLRAGSPQAVAALTAMMLCVGYLTASVGPWALGLAHDLSGGWDAPLVVWMLLALSILAPGAYVTRARQLGS